jgi:hypothetical protein
VIVSCDVIGIPTEVLEMVRSRWSRIFATNFTIFGGGRAANQYELPLG